MMFTNIICCMIHSRMSLYKEEIGRRLSYYKALLCQLVTR